MALAAHDWQYRIAALDGLPALPQGLVLLLRAERLGAAESDAVAAALAVDPGLSKAVIAAAARAGCRMGGLEAALEALGLAGARRCVAGAVALRLFPVDGGRHLDREVFWRQAACAAAYAEALADCAEEPLRGLLYAAGLLHDIGRAALDALAPEGCGRALTMGPAQGLHLLEAERRDVGIDHTLAGKWLAQAWGLPEACVAALWLHHQPSAALEHLPCPRRFVEVVSLAGMLASARVSGLPGAHAVPAAAEELRKRLGIDAERVARMMAAPVETLSAEAVAAPQPAEPLPADTHRIERALALYRGLHAFNLALGAAADRVAVLRALAERLRGETRIAAGLCVALDAEGGRLDGVAWGGADALHTFSVPDCGNAEAVRRALFDELDRVSPAAGEAQAARHGFVSAPMLCGGVQVGQIVYAAQSAPTGGARETQESLTEYAAAAGAALGRCNAMRHAEARSEGMATALWKSELSYRQSVRLERLSSVGAMAAGAAHEINNPLAIIAGRAQLLLSRTPEGDDARALETIVEQSRRAAKVLSDLLKFARPGEPQRQPATLDVLLHQVVGPMRERLAARGIRIAEDYAAALPRVRVDRRQMEEVFVNAILNAEQAMGGGGTLTLRARPSLDRQTVMVQVADTGGGIPPEILDRVFEPFFSHRAGQTGTGTGLGLAVCHGIVEAHRGSITLHTPPGGGTVCTITLPVEGDTLAARDAAPELSALQLDAPPDAAAALPIAPPAASTSAAAVAAAAPQSQRPAAGRAPRVLVIDDDEDLRTVLGEALGGRGYDVQLAADGLEGLAALLAAPPDLVLLDLRVPNLDGISLLRQMRDRGMRMPVLLMNGLSAADEVREALALGAAGALQKPFQLGHLFAGIGDALARRVA